MEPSLAVVQDYKFALTLISVKNGTNLASSFRTTFSVIAMALPEV
jgi:hypothetical protein